MPHGQPSNKRKHKRPPHKPLCSYIPLLEALKRLRETHRRIPQSPPAVYATEQELLQKGAVVFWDKNGAQMLLAPGMVHPGTWAFQGNNRYLRVA